MNVRVEYESTPIRHIAVQCPNCKKWFRGHEITNSELSYEHDIEFAVFHCPVCNRSFSARDNREDKLQVEESCYPEVYEGCLTRKEVWK